MRSSAILGAGSNRDFHRSLSINDRAMRRCLPTVTVAVSPFENGRISFGPPEFEAAPADPPAFRSGLQGVVVTAANTIAGSTQRTFAHMMGMYVTTGRRKIAVDVNLCLLYTSPSPRDRQKSRMPSSA